MMNITLEAKTKKRAEDLAARLSTHIPGGVNIALWSLPLLEIIVERLERLESTREVKP